MSYPTELITAMMDIAISLAREGDQPLGYPRDLIYDYEILRNFARPGDSIPWCTRVGYISTHIGSTALLVAETADRHGWDYYNLKVIEINRSPHAGHPPDIMGHITKIDGPEALLLMARDGQLTTEDRTTAVREGAACS